MILNRDIAYLKSIEYENSSKTYGNFFEKSPNYM
jgi:hypothetical protein